MIKAAFTTDNKMKISKSKLRQIIKEEARILQEASKEPGPYSAKQWEQEKKADLPKIIVDYGGQPEAGRPSLAQLQQKHGASEHDYPDPRYYSEETDFKTGDTYWRRKDEFDAWVRAYPLKSGLSPTGAETAEELRGLYPRLINSLEERGALSLVDKYLEEEDDAISALLRALERLA